MPRSVWKGPFVDGYLIARAEKVQAGGRREQIKTWSRRSTIMPQFVGLTFQVHNGKQFTPVLVSEDMIGHKLGEFAPTRNYYGDGADKKVESKYEGQAGGAAQPARGRRPLYADLDAL